MQDISFKPKVVIFCFTVTISLIAIMLSAPTQPIANQSESLLSVSILPVEPAAFTPTYQALGKTKSAQLQSITAQVSGKITYLNNAFIEGGTVKKGELIAQIDDREYQYILNQKEHELKIAQANLQLEFGEQKVAQREYEKLNDRLSSDNLILQKSLMLRVPQLEAAKAQVAIAQNNVKLAQQNFERCRIISDEPFVVLSKSVYLGNYVNVGDRIAELAQLTQLRIPLAVPNDVAKQLTLNQAVTILGQSQQSTRAVVTQISPSLSEKTQLQQIYLSVNNADQQFILGEFITTHLPLTHYHNTLSVPLSVIEHETLWVVDKHQQLQRKTVSIIWQDATHAVIENTLDPDDSIVQSKVENVTNGMRANIVSGVL